MVTMVVALSNIVVMTTDGMAIMIAFVKPTVVMVVGTTVVDTIVTNLSIVSYQCLNS
jgi:hypothetical protein